MAEGELPGVKHLARVFAGAFSAVEFIAENGMAQVMKMDPDLVRSATMQCAFDHADVVAGTENAIFSPGRTALAPRYTHSLPVDRVPGNRFVDHA